MRDGRALATVARRAALAGADVALHWSTRSAQLQISEKAASDDLVSQADCQAEAAICSVIADAFPDDGIIREEAGERVGYSSVEWVIDPIDGTTNYLYGRADWAVSVAARDAYDGTVLAAVVAEPALGLVTEAARGYGAWCGGQRLDCTRSRDLSRALIEMNYGRPEQRRLAGATLDALLPMVRDVRRGGSAAAALAQVAGGRAEGFWGPGLQAWDGSAGLLLVLEAGGRAGDLTGSSNGRWPESGDILAACPRLWEPLRGLIAPVSSLPVLRYE